MTTYRMPLVKELGALGLFVLAVVLVGGLGSLITGSSVTTWYPNLIKPDWTPDGRTIGYVWTVLYIMMALAAWLVWRSASRARIMIPLILWAVQLVFNLGWTYVFFGLRSPSWAFIELVFLWVLVAATTTAFYIHSKPAGWLMLPYLAWVTFAGALNYQIWQLNT